jgi:calmodulin
MTSEITQEQLVEYSEAFSLYDVNDDHTIPVGQVETVLRTLGVVVPQARLQRMRESKEDEGETHISFEEFLYLVGPEGKTSDRYTDAALESRSMKLREAFGVFDATGYGAIGVNELRRALRECLREHEINEIIQQVDPKQTGVVDVGRLSEFLVGL